MSGNDGKAGTCRMRIVHHMPLTNTRCSLLKLQCRLHWANTLVGTKPEPMPLQSSNAPQSVTEMVSKTAMLTSRLVCMLLLQAWIAKVSGIQTSGSRQGCFLREARLMV